MQQDAVHSSYLATSYVRARAAILAYLPVSLVAFVLALDLWHPSDVVFSVLYVAPIMLTVVFGTPRPTYLVFVVTSVATVAVAVISAVPAEPTSVLVNRVFALVAQALASTVVIQQLQIRERDRDRLSVQAALASQAHAAVVSAEAGFGALQGVLRALPDAVFTLDASGTIVEANSSAARLLGHSVLNVVGESWHTFVWALSAVPSTGESHPTVLPQGWPSDGPETVTGELIIQLAYDTDPVHCMITAAKVYQHEAVTGGLVVCRDITMLRDRERQKDEFVSMATHELKTPISTLRGYAQIAEAGANRMDASAVSANAEKIIRQADRLSRLVTDLLDVSRMQTGRMDLRISEVNIATVVRDAVDQQRAIHPDRCFEVVADAGAGVILADGQRIEQVLANLLDNAVKYSPDGGPVVVTLEWSTSDISISVTDHGVGIPTEEQGQLFQRFYRGRSRALKFPGLGVGLFISNTIVREHGGQMWVRSDESSGCTFGVILPTSPAMDREPHLIA
jgi:signal transduction histidine kinase